MWFINELKTQEKKLKFTHEVISSKENWKRVIFIDGKMFNLDGSAVSKFTCMTCEEKKNFFFNGN